MRRQMTKQPSGPVVRARPTPASMARTKKSSSMIMLPVLMVPMVMTIMVVVAMVVVMVPVFGMAVIGHAAIGVLDTAIGQMRMVVVVAVDRERLCRLGTEEPHVFRALADGGGG